MQPRNFSILIFLLLFLKVNSQDCEELLKDGLYQLIKVTTVTTLNQDLRTYFLSESFKNDMKKGKWGANLLIPINGVIITIGADSKDEQFIQFQTKVESSSSLNITNNEYQQIVQRLPNPELYNSYVQCKSDPLRKGLIQGEKIESEETVIFPFYFRQQSPNEKSPKVKSFTIEPKSAIIDNGGIKVGKRLPSYYMKIICRRSEVNEVIFNLQTDYGDVGGISGPTKSSRFETPIGTIISSFLSFDRFREALGEKGVWKETEKWAPCDGREVKNSQFSKYASGNVPDLRGYFLRGLNAFDTNPPVGVSARANIDPQEDRVVGQPQQDAIISHTHQYKKVQGRTMSFNVSTAGDMGMFHGIFVNTNVTDQDPKGQIETRPKNIAVYYYIKIN